MSITKQQITLPNFNSHDTRVQNSYIHVYREGGFRLQQEDINGKHIFHNYGQGDAALSLSYGSSYIISKIITVKQDASKIKEVAVIGDGINALMTSLQLLKRGYKVTLYGSNMPVKKVKQQRVVDPQQGLQFWYPGGYDNCDPLKHELIGKLSFQFFNECLLSNRYQSLRYISCYISNERGDDLKESVTQYINNEISGKKVSFGNEKIQQYICYRTILINTKLFIQEIFTQLKLRNITIIEKEFKNIDDVMSLKQQYIFNCLNSEVRTVFGDQSVQLTKGYYYSIQSKQIGQPDSFCFWISSQIDTEQDFFISIWNNKLQISARNSKAINQQNIKQSEQRVLVRAYHFIKERTIKPYKL